MRCYGNEVSTGCILGLGWIDGGSEAQRWCERNVFELALTSERLSEGEGP